MRWRKDRRPLWRRLLAGVPPSFWVLGPLTAIAAVWVWDGPPAGLARIVRDVAPAPAHDAERSGFARCGSGPRHTCVIDGDTFWYRGTKIRISDINTPETSGAGCAYERDLGERATQRLVALLNAGPFTIEPDVREVDRYGRSLARVTREGASLGAVLVAEGLAEPWQGYRRDWC